MLMYPLISKKNEDKAFHFQIVNQVLSRKVQPVGNYLKTP